jgi:signal transduction histidine kinase
VRLEPRDPALPEVALDARALDRLHPCHLYLDDRLAVVGAGRVIARLLPGLARRPRIENAFAFERPAAVHDFAALLRAGDQVFVLRSLKRPLLKLKGEALPIAGGRYAVLLMVPWISDTQLIDEFELTASDFARGDATPDLLFLVETQAQLLREAKELALDLKAARDQALIASRAKSEFLANMSHELRTPLNAIIGFSDYLMMLGDRAPGEQVADYVKDIYHSGQHLLAIVNDLLDLARIEAGKIALEESEFDLAALTQEAVRFVASQAEERNLDIRCEAFAPTSVRADARLIRQLLVNLLSNAVKFNKPGGRIAITLGDMPDGDLELAIADTGIGVDPTLIPELFEPFRQADSKLARSYGGTGLGLAIVRRLARLHGGEVVMESEPGIGATVRLRLPASRLLG